MTQPILANLLLYRNLLADPIIHAQQDTPCTLSPALSAELIAQAERLGLSGNLFANYLIYQLLQDTNLVTAALEQSDAPVLAPGLAAAFHHDMELIVRYLQSCRSPITDHAFLTDYTPTRPNLPESFSQFVQCVEASLQADDPVAALSCRLLAFYHQYGSGKISRYRGFRYQKDIGLIGIEHFDPISIDNIIGYERQKALLIANTEAFIQGLPSNHALLVGSRGTGKSSSVKAMINRYFRAGLRMVQISKDQLIDLADIMAELRTYQSKKFIIFLDDLSFEEHEFEYKSLKSAIDGGIEAAPPNVLIYATSNRRHLIKERWDDKVGDGQDIHRMDTINEKISLSDRFGITISYSAPNQKEYLAILEHLAEINDLDITSDELRAEAIKWEMTHSGRSGRTAQQLITYLLGARHEN